MNTVQETTFENAQANEFCEQIHEAFDCKVVEKITLKRPDGSDSQHVGVTVLHTDAEPEYLEDMPTTFKSGYTLHTVDDICVLVAAAVNSIMGMVSATLKCHWDNGHIVRFIFRDAVEIAPGDEVRPTLTFKAKYDGTMSFMGVFGLFRMICSNGLVVPVEGTKPASFKMKHTSGMRDKMPQLEKMFADAGECIQNMIATAKKLASKQVDFDEAFNAVFGKRPDAEKKAAATRYANRYDAVRAIAEQEQLALGQESLTAWIFYNAVQGYYQHTEGRKKDRSNEMAIEWANEKTEVLKALKVLID